MPLIRFLGFPDGATVSLEANQAGASDSATLANWSADPTGGGATPTIEIAVTRAPSAAQYAPEAVWFEAEATQFDVEPKPDAALVYDPTFHEIEYLWDFGDSGDVFAAPQNAPAVYKDANAAIGKLASHVYRQPGAYTVTCTARRVADPDTMEIEEAVATTLIVVGDPDALWTADNTIVVSDDGDFSGAPPSNWQCTNFNEWSNHPDPSGLRWWQDPNNWEGLLANFFPSPDAPVRVLFKRGGDFRSNRDVGIAHSNYSARQYPIVYFGGWGTGSKPVANLASALGLRGLAAKWDGIEFRYDYDDVTESGVRGTCVSIAGGGQALFTECDFNRAGTGIVVTFANEPSPLYLTIHDCTFEKLAAYGLLTETRPVNHDGAGGRDRIALIGCRDVDTGDAPHGMSTGSSSGNSQGPVRSHGNEDLIVASCDFYSRYGWSGNGQWGDGVAATAEQPILRVFSSGSPDTGQPNGRTLVTRCTGEGSEFVNLRALFQARPPMGNLLVDQNIHVGTPAMSTFGTIEAGATTIRNFLGIKPNVPQAFTMGAFFYVESFPHDPSWTWDEGARRAEPIRMHNNTYIVLDETELFLGAFGQIDDFVTYTDVNNVAYIPQRPGLTRHEDITPLDTTKLWDLRYLGRLEGGDGGVLQTQFAPPDGSASLYRPSSGSSVIDTAMGLTSYYDLLGHPRTTTQSRGALEP